MNPLDNPKQQMTFNIDLQNFTKVVFSPTNISQSPATSGWNIAINRTTFQGKSCSELGFPIEMCPNIGTYQ
jgi:hypothetical protein